ncbi:TIGR02117 family protein [Thalassovita sp.]|uniref:TIGR02117 family protein n=1 Tax=Thalassovita sp. TaxID=1979401 RepID=UPI002AB26659|nr:TIGR02117 family protein [Thalassovita sp.]
MALLSWLGKLFLSLLAALSALVMVYLAAALLGGVIAGDHADLPDGNAVTIGLVAGPIHNDFLLPLDAETRDQFAVLSLSDVPISHPQAEWLMVGWGAREFYTTVGDYSEVSWSAARRAIFGDQSVLRVDVYGALGDPDVVTWLQLSPAQYRALRHGIRQSFGDRPEVVPLPAVARGTFFAAEGRFDLLRTCNAWVGAQLRNAGVPFGRWTPIPTSVTLSLWRFHSGGN